MSSGERQTNPLCRRTRRPSGEGQTSPLCGRKESHLVKDKQVHVQKKRKTTGERQLCGRTSLSGEK